VGTFPQLVKIRRRLPHTGLADPEASLTEQLGRFTGAIPEGGDIAIAVGSRGIANHPLVVRVVSDFIRGQGGRPFVVPAMGSHGGATAEGQREVLTAYGITEETVNAPVHSSMEVVELPRSRSEVRLYIDKAAFESDGVILVNRVKPHTDFHGKYESGLVKMCVIGLGKHDGALEVHRHGVRGLRDLIAPAAREILETGKILGGIALVENAREETLAVRALRSDEIMSEEPALLEIARENMPTLPVDELDVLIIDRMGKDICGVGIDPNVVGRLSIRGEAEPSGPRISSIMVADLTPASHGNVLGVGLADVTTRRLFEKIDFEATYANAYASTFLERVKIPVVAATDREAFAFALRSAHAPEGRERIMRIESTLRIEALHVSEALLDGLLDRADIERLGPAADLFDEAGTLTEF
jgi:hypothetical protein